MDLTFLRSAVRGAVLEDARSREARSTDASLFRVVPAAVFVPEDADDLAAGVRAVREAAERGERVSLAARAGGTCMSGGSLTESIVVDCGKLARLEYGGGDAVAAEPGVFFRDVERATAKAGYMFPSYPASKNICAVGGMVANNAGGEKNLAYGKTSRHVRSLDVVLDDGSRATLRKLAEQELREKLALQTREGELYRQTHQLVTENWDKISAARPRVTKNSSGYALWDVWSPESGTFDLTQLVVGSQGTLCLVSEATLGLVRPKPHSELVVVFLDDERRVATLVRELLRFKPESLESFDHHTLGLAMRFIPVLASHLGRGLFSLAARFIPELLRVIRRGVPRLTILVELTDDSRESLGERVSALEEVLRAEGVEHRRAGSGGEANKYWAIRRESFSLLRERAGRRSTAPFIDDLVVRPEDLSAFMPKLEALMERHADVMTYTIAGHVGDGNFHIIPLVDLGDPAAVDAMCALQDEAVALTLSFGGSTSGEHNDGLIRTRYVAQQFGPEAERLFEEVKAIWDPRGIFNPGKKVGGDWAYARAHLRQK